MLARQWGLTDPVVTPHHGGMNSATWFVGQGERRWVAKLVPASAAARFAAGLAVARVVEGTGVATGAAVPTVDGDAVVAVDGGALALLRWVPGEPLTGAAPVEQRIIGGTLGHVHRALREVSLPGVDRFHWLDPAAAHLGVREWVRPAVAAAVRAYEGLRPAGLTWGLLHSDPAPEAFRLDRETGRCGLIDWGVGLAGPLLYDLASALMYVGGPKRGAALRDAYLAEGVLDRAELDRGLPVLLRLRWAVQADYFAQRIVADDRTGVAGPADNERGLADARRRLTGTG